MIARDANRVAATPYDVIVIGGGIYGAVVALQSVRCGLRTCLVEASDFGGRTSWNSLRIVHGGLRYLQTLDLPRFFASVMSRRWFARAFPPLLRPISCLMPLYREGLKRRSVMRAAFLVNDVLSWNRNAGVAEELRIPAGRILSREGALARCPLIRTENLDGAGVWTDYFMVSSERIVVETLRWACRLGADVLNYARALEILMERNRAAGIRVRDELSGESFDVLARHVVNCTGADVRGLVNAHTRDAGRLFRPSIAFNVVLPVRLPTDCAVAVSAPWPDAPVRFLVPQDGSILAGTCHLPRPADCVAAQPTRAEIEGFVAEIDQAMPGLKLRRQSIGRVFAGLLPARASGSAALASREVIHDHRSDGGPAGLVSVSGIKFTTAPSIAAAAVHALVQNVARVPAGRATSSIAPATAILTDARQLWTLPGDVLRESLLSTVRDESVQTLDDLVLRRTNWATTEANLTACYQRTAALLDGHVWRRNASPPDGVANSAIDSVRG